MKVLASDSFFQSLMKCFGWKAKFRRASLFIPRQIKYLFQTIIHGYDERVTWGLYNEIAKFILPRLKQYKKDLIKYENHEYSGYPSGLKSLKQWYGIIDKMIYSFECNVNDDFDSPDEETGIPLETDWIPCKDKKFYQLKFTGGPKFNKRKYNIREKKIQEGLELFSKHFQSLWW